MEELAKNMDMEPCVLRCRHTFCRGCLKGAHREFTSKLPLFAAFACDCWSHLDRLNVIADASMALCPICRAPISHREWHVILTGETAANMVTTKPLKRGRWQSRGSAEARYLRRQSERTAAAAATSAERPTTMATGQRVV